MSITHIYSPQTELQKLEHQTGVVKQDARDAILDVLRAAKGVTVPESPLAHGLRSGWKPVSVQGEPVSKVVMAQRD